MFLGIQGACDPRAAAVVIAETGERLTYAQLEERSTRLARHLRDSGLHVGDHVAALCGNDLRFFEVYWAALRSGLYLTPINHHLTAAEIAYIVNDSCATALIASGEFSAVAAEVAAETPQVRIRLAYSGAVARHDDYEAALASVSGEPLWDQPLGAEMLYSSGTTGRPKGVKPPLSGQQVDESDDVRITNFATLYGLDDSTVFLSPAPLYHASPIRFAAVVHRLGGTVLAMRKFDPQGVLAMIERYRVSHSMWVPTMFVRMLKLPAVVRDEADLSSLRVAVHAGAPCPVSVKREMIDWWGPILHESYGSTEGSGSTFIDSEEWLRKPGSVGRARMGILHICDDEGAEVPAGTIGTVYFERESVPFNYHNDEEKTKAARHPSHPTWSTSGDIGYVDDDGYLFLTDRKAFTIISGGVNIYPREIEDCLIAHPTVYDVAVVGAPDPDLGEMVMAYVQLVDGLSSGPELAAELIDFVRSRIARYKAVRRIEFVDELPRTPTGKLVKRHLKEIARN